MITLRNISLRRGPHLLLKEINWTIYHKQRIGMIGANGSGKTSLFTMLLGELPPDDGDLEIPRHIKLAHVAQETPALAQSALDFVLDGDAELRELEHALKIAEAEDNGTRIGQLHEKLSVIDAYTAPTRAAKLLAGLGFQNQEHENSVSEFSGGWRVRLNLAQALMSRSDILLLDEPTNHLDLDAVIWLEQWLQKYTGTLILISHDRDFLDQTVDHIAHLSHQQLKIYSGNYSTFENTRAAELMLQQAAFDKQQKQLAHLQSFVDRFRAKASKARQAQSRLKAIARMDVICAVQTESPFSFHFREPARCPNPLMTMSHITIGYGDHVVLKNISITIAPKDRIAILGPNGAGKSSFIKFLAGELLPQHGDCERGSGLKIGYFAQHQIDHLRSAESPLMHLQELNTNATDGELRKFLGSFGFTKDRVLEPVEHFSGGEKSRLALALLVWQKPNLLLLDEPTNHLDLNMRNALSLALQEYDGAMILVSHDRFLVRSTTDQLLLAANGLIQPLDGDLDSYQQWLLDYRKQQKNMSTTNENKPELSRKEQRQQQAKQRGQLRPLILKIQNFENELAQLEKEATALEQLLTDSSFYEPHRQDELKQRLLEQASLKKAQKIKEEEWLRACEQRDQFLHDEN